MESLSCTFPCSLFSLIWGLFSEHWHLEWVPGWLCGVEPLPFSHHRWDFIQTRNKLLLNRASLVVQWLRIHLSIQGTRVQALAWEDPTWHRAIKPVRHNYWACALESTSHNYEARMPQLLKPVRLEPVLCNKRSHCNEKPTHHSGEKPRLNATKESPCAATKTKRSQKLIN